MKNISLGLLIGIASCIYCENCIDTPDLYEDVFENIVETGEDMRCVSRDLMCSIVGPNSHQPGACPLNPSTKPDTISGGGSQHYWAWVSGSHNLETYLQIAQDNAGDRYAAAREMMLYAGFTEEYINHACSYSLSVFKREDLQDLFVPTWASFFLQLEKNPFNVFLDWSVSRQLLIEGFTNFTGISGCSGAMINTYCLPEYVDTYTLLSTILSDAGTLACVQEFREIFNNGESATVTQARAFLHGCFDANRLFTGVRYGYSLATDQITDREYVARNCLLETTRAASFTLYNPYIETPCIEVG